jgi:hypothetical protein
VPDEMISKVCQGLKLMEPYCRSFACITQKAECAFSWHHRKGVYVSWISLLPRWDLQRPFLELRESCCEFGVFLQKGQSETRSAQCMALRNAGLFVARACGEGAITYFLRNSKCQSSGYWDIWKKRVPGRSEGWFLRYE